MTQAFERRPPGRQLPRGEPSCIAERTGRVQLFVGLRDPYSGQVCCCSMCWVAIHQRFVAVVDGCVCKDCSAARRALAWLRAEHDPQFRLQLAATSLERAAPQPVAPPAAPQRAPQRRPNPTPAPRQQRPPPVAYRGRR